MIPDFPREIMYPDGKETIPDCRSFRQSPINFRKQKRFWSTGKKRGRGHFSFILPDCRHDSPLLNRQQFHPAVPEEDVTENDAGLRWAIPVEKCWLANEKLIRKPSKVIWLYETERQWRVSVLLRKKRYLVYAARSNRHAKKNCPFCCRACVWVHTPHTRGLTLAHSKNVFDCNASRSIFNLLVNIFGKCIRSLTIFLGKTDVYLWPRA